MSLPDSNGAGDDATLLAPLADEPPGDLPAPVAERLDRTLQPGDQVGEYEIGEKLGEGGFGTVYRAVHPLIGKNAAVKVLSREFSANAQIVSRFIAEARAANTIRHANIIDIFNFGTLDDGRHYFVMELLDGVSLEDFLADHGALDPPLLLQIMGAVAQALDAAHAKGIVHRDLKPDNIFLCFDDQGRPIPKLLDFGIAKLLGDAATISGHRTRTGTPIGTPHYMSPEQCQGEAVDELADIYGFGVVCYEGLTGTKPFDAESFLKLMNLHSTGERPLASKVNPALDPAFDAPLRRLLAIAKDERPATIGAAFDLLQTAAQAAGINVERPRMVSESLRRPPAIGGGAAGSSVAAASAADGTAPTAAGEPGDARPAKRALWLAGAGVVAVGGVLYALTVLGTDEDAPAVAGPSAGPTIAAPTQTATTRPSASAAPAAQPARLTLRIETKAKGARAFIGDHELGPCPGDVTLDDPAGKPVTIVVKAPGYHDAKATVVPEEGATVTINPKPKGGSAPLDDDLADPQW